MKVFISWSGEDGRTLAEIMHRWLPSVIQAVKPYFSPDNMAKGARWGTEMAEELESSQIGLLIITRSTLDAPWIMFEAGALSKNVGKAKVSPILFDLEPTDIKGPLVQFQAAKFEKTDMKRVMRMINSELGDSALANDVLDTAFEMWWPLLEQAVGAELERVGKRGSQALRPERELLEEILTLTRALAQREIKEEKSKRPKLLRQEKRIKVPDSKETSLSEKEIRSRLEQGGNLAGANMMDTNLKGWDLSGANLHGANLVCADLTGTKLINADLRGANLERAVLLDADVQGANLSCVNFWGATLNNLRNLDSVVSMELANFYETEGLTDTDQQLINQKHTLSLADYMGFIEFFHKEQGMSKAEISDLFLWTAHPHFRLYLTGIPEK